MPTNSSWDKLLRMKMKRLTEIESRPHNSTYTQAGVSRFYESEQALNPSFVLLMKFSAKNPCLRVAAKPCCTVDGSSEHSCHLPIGGGGGMRKGKAGMMGASPAGYPSSEGGRIFFGGAWIFGGGDVNCDVICIGWEKIIKYCHNRGVSNMRNVRFA